MAGNGRSAWIYYTYSGGLQCCFNISTCCKKVGHSTCHNCQVLWQILLHDISRIYIGSWSIQYLFSQEAKYWDSCGVICSYPGADDSVMTMYHRIICTVVLFTVIQACWWRAICKEAAQWLFKPEKSSFKQSWNHRRAFSFNTCTLFNETFFSSITKEEEETRHSDILHSINSSDGSTHR